MPVEMIIDQWNPANKRYRFETWCYGPKSCALYKAGPVRTVPGRMSRAACSPDRCSRRSQTATDTFVAGTGIGTL